MTKLFAIVALFLTSCAHTRNNDGYPIPTSKSDCMQLFADIQDVQTARHDLMDKMNRVIQAYENGKMSKARFQKKRKAWLENEGRHRNYVTFLYDIGYEYNCF